MAENNFKPFAVGAGANVSSQTDWENLLALSTGFTAGIARSDQVNKALRQGTVMASVLGQIILEQTAEDVLDNGDTDTLKGQLLAALASLQIDFVYPVGLFCSSLRTKPQHAFPRHNLELHWRKQNNPTWASGWIGCSGYRGADTVSLAKANLPAQALSITGTAASVDLGTKLRTARGALTRMG